MEKGDFVKVEYTGRLENGDVFDSTDPSELEGAGGPAVVVLGAGHLIEGVEEAIKEMGPGDERELEVPPEKAFGDRDPKKIRFFKLEQFKKEGVRPYPGMRLTIDGRMATVKSVSSGRVVVDFNHPLAGLTLSYDLKLLGPVEEPLERAKGLLEFHLGREVEVEEEDGGLVAKGVPEPLQGRLGGELEKYTAFKNIRFVTLEGEDYGEHSQGGKGKG